MKNQTKDIIKEWNKIKNNLKKGTIPNLKLIKLKLLLWKNTTNDSKTLTKLLTTQEIIFLSELYLGEKLIYCPIIKQYINNKPVFDDIALSWVTNVKIDNEDTYFKMNLDGYVDVADIKRSAIKNFIKTPTGSLRIEQLKENLQKNNYGNNIDTDKIDTIIRLHELSIPLKENIISEDTILPPIYQVTEFTKKSV